MTLKELEIGKSAVVEKVGGEGALRQHFLDMGVIPGAEVTAVRLAPMGDPIELMIHGYELTLRLSDAEKIEIKEGGPPRETGSKKKKKKLRNQLPHTIHTQGVLYCASAGYKVA